MQSFFKLGVCDRYADSGIFREVAQIVPFPFLLPSPFSPVPEVKWKHGCVIMLLWRGKAKRVSAFLF